MAQLPPGLRSSLYLRDDDYRLSFLSGNFITLTNLADEDMERITERRLSPLYVSLHAVDPIVRSELLCPRVTDRALDRFDALLQAGIELHVQIVLVPDVNDGAVLDETLAWLDSRDGVGSVGVVPVGYTRFSTEIDESFTRTSAAATVLAQVQAWQLRHRATSGTSLVHAADEFYLTAGAPLPADDWYDGFPQLENGIGLVRSFVDEIIDERERLEAAISALPPDVESITVVTGMLAATTLGGALEACGGAGRIRILAVPNRFFGGNVSVAGLLTGIDVVEALQDDACGVYVIPDVLFNSDGLTLDGMTRAELSERVDGDVRIASPDGTGLLDTLHL